MQVEEPRGDLRVLRALLACVPADELRLHGNALVRSELLSIQHLLVDAATAMVQLQEVQEAVARAERGRAGVGRTDSLMALVGIVEELQQSLLQGVKRFAAPEQSESVRRTIGSLVLPVPPSNKPTNRHVVAPIIADPTEQRRPKRYQGMSLTQPLLSEPSAPYQSGPQGDNQPGQTSSHPVDISSETSVPEVIDLLSDEEEGEEDTSCTQEPNRSSALILAAQRPATDPVRIPVIDEAAFDDPSLRATMEYAKRALERATRAKEKTNDGISLVKCVAYVLSALRSLGNLGKNKHLQALPTQALEDIAWSMDTAISMILETADTLHGDTYHDLSYLLIELSRFFRACSSPVFSTPFLQVHKRLEAIQIEGKIRICSEETIRTMWVNTIVKSAQIAREIDGLNSNERPKRFEELLSRLCSFFLNVARRGKSVTRYFTPIEFERVTIAVEIAATSTAEQGNSLAHQKMLAELMQNVVSRFPSFRPILAKPLQKLAHHVESEKTKRLSVHVQVEVDIALGKVMSWKTESFTINEFDEVIPAISKVLRFKRNMWDRPKGRPKSAQVYQGTEGSYSDGQEREVDGNPGVTTGEDGGSCEVLKQRVIAAKARQSGNLLEESNGDFKSDGGCGVMVKLTKRDPLARNCQSRLSKMPRAQVLTKLLRRFDAQELRTHSNAMLRGTVVATRDTLQEVVVAMNRLQAAQRESWSNMARPVL